jgi:SAM-dependent methyltransferase
MSYAELTFKDRNPLKRWLQNQRLVSAINLYKCTEQNPSQLCDFGAGNGELCKLLAEEYQSSRIICYEPTPTLLSEAKQNLMALENVGFYQNIHNLQQETLDVVFCLEVFEHLPPEETLNALKEISNLLKPGGVLIIGVPVEIGFPALYKGVFRMTRRYGNFDANIKNVILSFIGRPPKNRPISEIAPGFKFYHPHTGFDFHQLEKTIKSYFNLNQVSASPFAILGSWLMPEVYFVAKKSS